MGLQLYIKNPVSASLVAVSYQYLYFVLVHQEHRLPTINAITVPDDLKDPYRLNTFAERYFYRKYIMLLLL